MALINPSNDPSNVALYHGMALNPKTKGVQCCYCGIKVEGFDGLQHHLAGIRGNIGECREVPKEVKNFFKDGLTLVKVGRDGDADRPIPSSKRRCTSNGSDRANVQNPRLPSKETSSENGRLTTLRNCSSKEGMNPASIAAKRSIGRFIFENDMDFSVVANPSFRAMMGVSSKKAEAIHCIPSVSELRGWILEEELNDVENYVNDVRLSWACTGCSILLDGWTDSLGRNLVSVVIDCPKGPMYYKSADVSPSKGVDALKNVLESVLEEVGIQNVVQIVAHTTSQNLDAVGERILAKHRPLFWTVSATKCLSLILDNFARNDPIKRTLEKAKFITRFIYTHVDVLESLRRHIRGCDLLKPSKIKSATPFLTLENLLTERTDLERMFKSPEWSNSPWALTNDGQRVAHLVTDTSFWDEVTVAAKASIPLVNAISLINGNGGPNLGFIYEIMDQIKETISDEFEGRKTQYDRYWQMIDEIWNSVLHSPLHAAGYFLNPRLQFTEDFFADQEVAGGLMITFVRMVNGLRVQDKVSKQMELYGRHDGNFELGSKDKDNLLPAAWWKRYGGHCPDLQKVAVKILSQTCNGVESFELKRDLAEKLLSDTGRNAAEQKKLSDFTHLQYNLKLKQWKLGPKYDILADKIEPTDDWIVDTTQHATGTTSDVEKPDEAGSSHIEPKMESEA